MLRALSVNQASNCETAKNKTCHCRCGGKLHGIKRGGDEPRRDFFEQLPADDPHHVRSADEIKHRRHKTGLLESNGQRRLFPLENRHDSTP